MKDTCGAVQGARLGMRTFCVRHIVFNISPIPLHRLRPRALGVPPRWSSISPPGTAVPTPPAQPTSAQSSRPQSRGPNPSRGAPIHSGRRVVSYGTRAAFASPLLCPFKGADSPFLRIISELVVTIGSHFSEYNST